jgi:membrane fusion protein, multidrug efflux system
MRTRTALLLALVAGLACKGAAPPARQRPPPSVTTAPVMVRDVPVEIRSPVDLRPLEQYDVGAKAIGYLDAVLVDRGDRVHRGQLLAVVRPSDLSDQLESSRGTLAQSQAQAALARANLERSERLAPTGFVSQQDLQSQQTAVRSAEAALAAAQANVGAVATRLGETRILSPLDGYVSARRLDPGALVGPGAPSSAILTIQRLDVLRVFVPVNERDVAQLRVGQEAHVEVDALPGQVLQGKVVRVSPSFDTGARTLDAEVQLANPDGLLRPGMYGRTAIVTDVHRGAVVIPAQTAQISGDRTYVFVLDLSSPPAADPAAAPASAAQPPAGGQAQAGKKEQGSPAAVPARVKRVPVQVGVDGGDWLEIVAGLGPSDEIVTAGMDAVSDGVQVRAFRNLDAFTGKPLTAAAQ